MKVSIRTFVAATLSALLVFVFAPIEKTAIADAAQKPRIVDIAIGAYHVLALDSEGGVWSWGKTTMGAMGHGDSDDIPTPKKIAGLPPVKSIAAGNYHSVAVDKDGHVWVWGINDVGQFGNGEYTKRVQNRIEGTKVPVKNGLSGIASVAAGDANTYAIDVEGHVYEWGGAFQIDDERLDEAGRQTEMAKLRPRKVEGLEQIVYVTYDVNYRDMESYAVDRNGSVWRWDFRLPYDPEPSVERVQEVGNVKQFRAWHGFNWAQDASGTWKQWGLDLFDESGLNPLGKENADRIARNDVPVAAPQLQGFAQIEVSTYRYGDQSLVGLKPDGTVWTWGSNTEGQLGVSGIQKTSQWIQVEIPDKIVKVAAFGGTVFAIDEDGGVYSWGSNFSNKLGYGSQALKWSVPKRLPDFGADEANAGQQQSQPSDGQRQGQSTTGQPAAANPAAHIYLNGKRLDFEAVIIQGSTMVPFRDLFGAFNMSVDWNQQTKTVIAKKEGLTLQLTVGSTTAYVNGEQRELSVAPTAVNGKTFVNLRFISETIGAQVQYQKVSQDTAEVRITYAN